MIATQSKTFRILLLLLATHLLMPLAFAWGATVTWNIVITPKNSGTVIWATSSPSGSGTLVKSGKVTFNNGAFVDLTFQPNPGGTIVSVFKNLDNVTSWLDAQHHFQFGPVGSPHTITVIFSGGTPVPVDPTGNFDFSFPTGNPDLTGIASISGNYQGVTREKKRQYNFDVAQDESGKLAIMGTTTGYLSKDGNPTVSGNIGAITTVSEKPTAQLKGSFTGTCDGVPVTAKGTAKSPVELTDIGGGVSGISATAGGSAKVGGVPSSSKNGPISHSVAPSQASNFSKSWSLRLDIQSKVNSKTGKPYIGATGQLLLPNGDTILYPERVVKYSKKGYSITFKGGTNITIQPNKIDKKSKVVIKGMTLEEQGQVWKPTAGTMTYQFLGQKGTESLLDFLP
jgi:hypothetical protein